MQEIPSSKITNNLIMFVYYLDKGYKTEPQTVATAVQRMDTNRIPKQAMQ
jgi:hypothetical protein